MPQSAHNILFKLESRPEERFHLQLSASTPAFHNEIDIAYRTPKQEGYEPEDLTSFPAGNSVRQTASREKNKPRTARVGAKAQKAISKAQKLKGDPSGFVKLQLVFENFKKLEGDPLET